MAPNRSGQRVFIQAGDYKNRQFLAFFRSHRSRRIALRTIYEGGSFYGGDIQSASFELIFKPVPQLHLSTEHTFDRVDVPGGSFDSLISTLLVSYNFSPALTTRIATQYSSLLEDFVLNFRLRWIYAPRSEVWLVYDETRRFPTLGSLLRDRALILKVVHNFNF